MRGAYMRHQGKRSGRRQGAAGKRRMTGFMQPCFLLQLYGQDRHGYDLLQGLQEFMADADALDPSIIYRIMREMEENGLVESYEGTVSRGPRRRMYSLTVEGKKQLSRWIDDLKQTRDEINHLLAVFKKQVTNYQP